MERRPGLRPRATFILAAALAAVFLGASTPAPAQPAGDFVTVQGGNLVYRGQPIKLKGVNFYPKDQPWADMWTQWDGEAARRDLSRAAEIGANTVRVLAPFKPQFGWTTRETGDLRPEYLDELRQLLQIAGELDMKVMVALFDFYDPGTDTLPPAEAEARALRYLRGIVSALANDDRVLAWDIHNEPDHYETWRDDRKPEVFVRWMARMAAEIRSLDPNHPITVGMGQFDNLFVADESGAPAIDEPNRGLTAADFSDFLSFHSYNAGNIDWQISYVKARTGKPVVLQEMGWPTGPACNEPEYNEQHQVHLYDLMLQGARKHDLAGVLNWQLWDFRPGASAGAGRETREDYFGLLRRDGSWKPAMPLLRDGWPAQPLPSATESNLPLTAQPRRQPPVNDPNYLAPMYFPETGHYLYGAFQRYWRRFGGLEIFGYPLTEQRMEGEYWVQYFERARFEFHPEYERTDPNWDKLPGDQRLKLQVQLSLLGADLVKERTGGKGYLPADRATLPSGAVVFPETGHSISGRIAEYWQSRNGLTNFGYPLSEPVQEVSKTDGKTYTVQYFERTRLELHPEN
ncbi:MAG TPA: cellulase family glycosylhydrolase, partial [Chloroflexia bacterium]|nr:cellulase family glycosylhydrolase [Chloroflexia bacterium]